MATRDGVIYKQVSDNLASQDYKEGFSKGFAEGVTLVLQIIQRLPNDIVDILTEIAEQEANAASSD